MLQILNLYMICKYMFPFYRLFFHFKKIIILFINIFLSSWLCGLFSSCGKRKLLSSCSTRASHYGSLPCWEHRALGCLGFSSCGTWTQQLQFPGSGAQAQQLWHTGLVISQHVASSQIRDRTHVSCISRQILHL